VFPVGCGRNISVIFTRISGFEGLREEYREKG
jgi:hypothetical protein